jgi:glycosyltransferase involved in cell wall biosynthesis
MTLKLRERVATTKAGAPGARYDVTALVCGRGRIAWVEGRHGSPKGDVAVIGLVAALPPQIGGVPSFAGWLLDHQEALGCVFVPFDLWRPPAGPGGGKVTLRAVVLQLRNGARFLPWLVRAPRVVHYCVAGNPTGLARDLLFVQLLRLTRRKVIGHIHSGTDLERLSYSRVYRWAIRLHGRLSDETVAISPSAAGLLRQHGMVVSTVLNPMRLEVETAPTQADDRDLRLLFVGSYGEEKGCGELLAALARARANGVRATLTFVGKEKYRGEEAILRASVARLGLDGAVRFVGTLAGPELRSAYLGADVLCLPSHREGLPMVVLEAMALGVPVLATRIGAIPDVVVHKETGLLVEPGDVRGLEAAISALARDRGLRSGLGDAARRHILSIAAEEEVAARWRGIYRRLFEASGIRAGVV